MDGGKSAAPSAALDQQFELLAVSKQAKRSQRAAAVCSSYYGLATDVFANSRGRRTPFLPCSLPAPSSPFFAVD